MTAGTVMAGVNAFGSEASSASEKDNAIGPEAVPIQLTINGVLKEVSVEPRETLADTLRDHLHLTGTKVACNRGSCSSCTVLLDGVPVNSCMISALDAVGRDVSTIESLASNGELHPLQQAFIDHDASQCGFCTPGMLMSCAHLLQTNPHPTFEEVKRAISGNLCRCGTHPHIFKAVLEVADKQKRK
ncbi:(2Fe-2S)-binding protein [Sulfurimonas sp. HSL3-7]|uniref:(2Fe-2S)-binding protein n=1 Tax=Sulfonitrofixus jiaomeiensis TaxID=3131938 RepID=UPI0031F81BF7